MKLGLISPCEPASYQRAKDYGVDFVEFDLNYPRYFGQPVDQYLAIKEDLKKASEETGIETGAVGRWASPIVAKDGSINEEEWSEVKKVIDLGKYLGAPNYLCSVAYVPELTYYQNITASIKALRQIVAYAKENGMKTSIVNCMMGGNYIRTPEQWKLVLDEVPGLYIKYDPSHSFVHGGENGAYFKETMEWGGHFGYVHIKGVLQVGDSHEPESWRNYNIRLDHPDWKGLDEVFGGSYITDNNYDNPPAGLDTINWRAFFGALYKHDYDGYLAIEPHSPSWRSGAKGDWGIRFTVNYIRGLMMDLGQNK